MLNRLDTEFKEDLKQKMREARDQNEDVCNKSKRVVVALPSKRSGRKYGLIAASLAACVIAGTGLMISESNRKKGNTIAWSQNIYNIEGVTLKTSESEKLQMFDSKPSDEKQMSYLTTVETEDLGILTIQTFSDGVTVRSLSNPEKEGEEICTSVEVATTKNQEKVVYRTEKGIHVGSKKEEVYEAYGLSDQTLIKKESQENMERLGGLDGVKEEETLEKEFDEMNYTGVDSEGQRYLFFFKDQKIAWIRLVSTTQSMKLRGVELEDGNLQIYDKVGIQTDKCLKAIIRHDAMALKGMVVDTISEEEIKEYLNEMLRFKGTEITMISTSGLKKVESDDQGGRFTESISCDAVYVSDKRKEYIAVKIDVYVSKDGKTVTFTKLPEIYRCRGGE